MVIQFKDWKSLLSRKSRRVHWLLRYWVLDKYREQLRVVALACCALGLILSGWSAYLELAPPARETGATTAAVAQPVRALVWWGYLIWLVVSVVISYALAPKPESAKPIEGREPEVKDGKALRRIYGTVWTDDSGIVGWVNGDPVPIRKGGKK